MRGWQDVVIPPEGIADFAHAPAPYYLDDDATETAPERTITLLFIGTIPPDEWHIPHNVRLEVQRHHGQRPGYLISEQRTEDYQRDLASSVFCLAPSGQGGGWGMRFGSAVVTGCIPVIVMDNSTEVSKGATLMHMTVHRPCLFMAWVRRGRLRFE